MAISLTNLLFAYPEQQNKQVLNITKWSVAKKEQVFVYGPSGAGKSTLLNLISGILVPNEGEISVLGQRLNKMRHRQRDQFRANHIGYVFQQFNLIPYLNARENIQLASHFSRHSKVNASKNEIENLLTQLNIAPDAWHKPTSKLSIGQQQRVAIARALINKPELLIADEPTSSLDKHNRDNFMSILMSLVVTNNITLIFVSHDMSLSHYFNRIDSLVEINRTNGKNTCF